HSLHVRVDVERAEAAAEGLVLLMRQMLIAEEDDLMVEKRPVNVVEGFVVEVGGKIDARDLGAERAGNAVHLDFIVGHLRLRAFGLISPSPSGSRGAPPDGRNRRRHWDNRRSAGRTSC